LAVLSDKDDLDSGDSAATKTTMAVLTDKDIGSGAERQNDSQW
jgi:hypothetical protein